MSDKVESIGEASISSSHSSYVGKAGGAGYAKEAYEYKNEADEQIKTEIIDQVQSIPLESQSPENVTKDIEELKKKIGDYEAELSGAEAEEQQRKHMGMPETKPGTEGEQATDFKSSVKTKGAEEVKNIKETKAAKRANQVDEKKGENQIEEAKDEMKKPKNWDADLSADCQSVANERTQKGFKNNNPNGPWADRMGQTTSPQLNPEMGLQSGSLAKLIRNYETAIQSGATILPDTHQIVQTTLNMSGLGNLEVTPVLNPGQMSNTTGKN
jgi:hypothetical protein